MRRARIALIVLIMMISAFPLRALAAEVERVEQGNLVLEGIPQIPERVKSRLGRYLNTRSASFSGWHPTGEGVLISTRFGETSQIHWVREPGGARRQLTFFAEPVRGATASPNAGVGGFIFGKDVGGGESYQLFFFDLEDGAQRLLTDGKSRNMGPTWSNDGKRFAYSTTRRNARDYDLHVAGIDAGGESVPVLEEGGVWGVAEWSPDDTKLLVGRFVSANESYPYILDLQTKKLTQINPTEEKVAYGGATFARDGKGIYGTSDEGSEYSRLWYHDLATGEFTILSGGIPWDVEEIGLSKDGRYLAFVVNEDGVSKLHVLDLEQDRNVELTGVPAGQIRGLEFSSGAHLLGMTIGTSRTPGDVYSYDLDSGARQRWTYSEIGGMHADDLVEPELVHYPTFDQVDGAPRMIPAFYYRPKGKGLHPVLIDIHGGPEGQERPGFNSIIQYAVNELGIAVLAPNVRGSAGYGKSFLKLDNGYKREDSVKDIGKLLDWIETRPELDGGRVAVYGGSYGGYMVLASMVHFNDRLRAGIDVVGISNFVTFLENTKPYRRDLRRAEYGDERDPEMREFLNRISPLTNADKITSPMLIAQGLNDPRVPVTESEQIVETIRENGGEAWYFLATDEGHGFAKKSNRDTFYAVVSLFLETYLLPSEGDGAAALAN